MAKPNFQDQIILHTAKHFILVLLQISILLIHGLVHKQIHKFAIISSMNSIYNAWDTRYILQILKSVSFAF